VTGTTRVAVHNAITASLISLYIQDILS